VLMHTQEILNRYFRMLQVDAVTLYPPSLDGETMCETIGESIARATSEFRSKFPSESKGKVSQAMSNSQQTLSSGASSLETGSKSGSTSKWDTRMEDLAAEEARKHADGRKKADERAQQLRDKFLNDPACRNTLVGARKIISDIWENLDIGNREDCHRLLEEYVRMVLNDAIPWSSQDARDQFILARNALKEIDPPEGHASVTDAATQSFFLVICSLLFNGPNRYDLIMPHNLRGLPVREGETFCKAWRFATESIP
jgi:hypothetical protein